jgi:hypothetical protein
MSWLYARVGSQVGLQFIGSHPRARSSLPQMLANLATHGIGTMQAQLNNALNHSAVYAPHTGDVIDPEHTIFVPRALVFRLSKWCDHEGAGENDARKFTRKLFRHSNEEDTIPRRFLDQENRPKPSESQALADFERWADAVIVAWGGVPNKAPAIAAALATW